MYNKKLIRYLVIMIMMNVFLPIVAVRINIILTGFVFNVFLFHVLIFIKNPRFFILKPLRYTYIYIFIYFFMMYIGHYDISIEWLYGNVFPIYLSITILTYFFWSGDFEGLKIVILFTLGFIAITCITSAIGNTLHPFATRYLYGVRDNIAKINRYERMGIARYAFFSGLPMIIPVLFAQYKIARKKYKKYLIFLIVFIMISIILASITAPIILAFIALFLSLIGMDKFKKNILTFVFLLLIILIIPRSFYAKILYSISDQTTNQVIKPRIYDLGYMFDHKIDFSASENTNVEYRLYRYVINYNQFVEAPLIGKGYMGNYHIFWLNILAQFGLVGLFPILLNLITQTKTNIKYFNMQFRYYYLLSIFIFIALGFMKAIAGIDIYLYLYFVVPGIYFIGYKETPNEIKPKG